MGEYMYAYGSYNNIIQFYLNLQNSTTWSIKIAFQLYQFWKWIQDKM